MKNIKLWSASPSVFIGSSIAVSALFFLSIGWPEFAGFSELIFFISACLVVFDLFEILLKLYRRQSIWVYLVAMLISAMPLCFMVRIYLNSFTKF